MFRQIIVLGIGFACGYGVRELISRRRRAVAREKFSRRQEEKREQKRYDESNGDVLPGPYPPDFGASEPLNDRAPQGRNSSFGLEATV